MDENLKTTIKALGYLSTVGLAMALAIALGAYGGYYLDKKFGTRPWFFYVGLCFGIAAAFRNLQILYKKSRDL